MTFPRIDDAGTSPGLASAGSPPRKCWPTGTGRPKRKLVAEWLRRTCRTAGARNTASRWPPRRAGVSSPPRGAANSILASKAPNTENPAHAIGPCRPPKKISKPVRRQHAHLVLGGVMHNFEHLRETKDLERFYHWCKRGKWTGRGNSRQLLALFALFAQNIIPSPDEEDGYSVSLGTVVSATKRRVPHP